jgi:hypothetical protein
MEDVYLVKPDYLMKLGGINKNVDIDLILPAIIAVQDIYIQQILGTPLYNDLKTKIIAEPNLATHPNEKDLINNYIAKVLVWYLKMEVGNELSVRFVNKGVVSIQSDKSQPVEANVFKNMVDLNRSKAESYAELLTKHLRLNTVTFPKYYEFSVEGLKPTIKNFTSGVYMKNVSNTIDYNGSNFTHDANY